MFRFKHTHEGDYLESNGRIMIIIMWVGVLRDQIDILVFIYSMPGYSVSIKERMLYSSCKNAVVDVIEKLYSIEIAKKVEVDSGAELTQEFLQVIFSTRNYIYYIFYNSIQGEIHPVKSLNKPKFARPAAPSRGNKRITKAPPS